MKVLHIGGNRYRPLDFDYATKKIWVQLSSGFCEYHVVARSLTCKGSKSREGRIFLYLLPSFVNSMIEFFFTSWLIVWRVFILKPDRLVVQCPVIGGLAAAFCSAVFKIPLLVELHGAHYFYPKLAGVRGRVEFLFYRLFSSFAFFQAKKIRSLSPHMTESLIEVYGSHLKSKVVEIPTRVDLKVFSAVKPTYEISGPLKIISVGSYIPVKNLAALIEDLQKTGRGFTLTLAGDGPLMPEYQRLAKRLGVEDKIVCTGRLSHEILADLLVKHDLYVHYSLTEGLARAILEAMAVGLPVVATNVGFIRGVLEDKKNCILLNNERSLESALSELVADKSLRERLGSAARQMIYEKYEAESVFSLYRQTIVNLCH